MTPLNEKKRNEFSEGFISRLEGLVKKEDRGDLAMLRRGLGKDVPFEVYRFMPFSGKRWQEKAALLIGPLFAYWHQGEDKPINAEEGKNFGDSMRALVNSMVQEGSELDDAMKRVERRFGAMLNCHSDDLNNHLRHSVSLLRSKDVAVNWRLLCDHVQQWDHPDRWVQHKWARSFWVPRSKELPENDAMDESPVETDVDEGVE